MRRAAPALCVLVWLVSLGLGTERLQPLHPTRHDLAPRLLGAYRIRLRPPLFHSQTPGVDSLGHVRLRGDLPRHAWAVHSPHALEIFAQKTKGRPDRIGTPSDFCRNCLTHLL